MRTSAPGSSPARLVLARAPRGFTLLELLVVLAIAAIATAGVAFALRDTGGAALEREGQRLAALLEAGRAQSRLTGLPVRWRVTDDGFRFEGLPDDALPRHWLAAGTRAVGTPVLVLGPEPIIGPQAVTLAHPGQAQYTVHVATDGLRPFQATPATP